MVPKFWNFAYLEDLQNFYFSSNFHMCDAFFFFFLWNDCDNAFSLAIETIVTVPSASIPADLNDCDNAFS